MNFVTNGLRDDYWWEQYKELENIPDFVPNPLGDRYPFTSALNAVWRGLLSLLIDELVAEQRVDYLHRCWLLDEFGHSRESASHPLKRLWVLME